MIQKIKVKQILSFYCLENERKYFFVSFIDENNRKRALTFIEPKIVFNDGELKWCCKKYEENDMSLIEGVVCEK